MLCIAGGKGGCGKTTTALGLASALVQTGRRPVVVDADVEMPDLSRRTATIGTDGLGSLAGGTPIRKVLTPSEEFPGVRVVPAGETADIRPALRRLSTYREPVIVDAPAGARPDVATALNCATRTLLVQTTTPASLEDGVKTAAMSAAVDTPVEGVLLRAVAAGSADSGVTGAHVRRLLDAPVLARMPTVDTDVLAQPAVRATHHQLSQSIFGSPGRDTRRTGVRRSL